MALIISFFILTVLKVNIVWTTDFPSNVHEMMTPEEIYQTFGTDDGSVPDYQVLSVVLPGTERRRLPDVEIHFKVEINGTETNLTFKPTAGYLAARYTPVWLAVTDQEAYQKIRYDPLLNAMADIGEFKMYHDVDNEAAIVVYADPDHEAVIEGIVTSDYAIKSLPKRLENKTLTAGDDYSLETPLVSNRSILPDADEVTSYLVLFESPRSAKNASYNAPRHRQKRQSHSGERRQTIPEVVYPEILLVLDHSAIRNHTITQALRFMLAFWNAVDMVYSRLNNPKVYLNIAGIIISADDTATPYIDKDTSIKKKSYSRYLQSGFRRYFGLEQDRFPPGQYDMILAMTSITLCAAEVDPCAVQLGFATRGHACTPKEFLEDFLITAVGVIYYTWMFHGVDTAVHESAHLLGVGHDEGKNETFDCPHTEGYAMSTAAEFDHQSFKWSSCSERYFRVYFNSTESQCLDNTPTWIKPVTKVLPGRWLTLDGQCRNEGFGESCEIPDLPACEKKACRVTNSWACEISELIPLPGTKCGEKKYCEDSRCVDE